MILKFGESWLNRSFGPPPPILPSPYGPLDDIPWTEAIVLPYAQSVSQYSWWTDGETLQSLNRGNNTSYTIGNNTNGMYRITNPAVERASDGHRMGYVLTGQTATILAYDFDAKTVNEMSLTDNFTPNYVTEVWNGKVGVYAYNILRIFDMVLQTWSSSLPIFLGSNGLYKSKVSPEGKCISVHPDANVFSLLDISAGTTTEVSNPAPATGNWGVSSDYYLIGPAISDIITYNNKEYCVVGSYGAIEALKLVNLTDGVITNITMPDGRAWGGYGFPKWVGTKLLILVNASSLVVVFDISTQSATTITLSPPDTSISWGRSGAYSVPIGTKIVVGHIVGSSYVMIFDMSTNTATFVDVGLGYPQYISKPVGNYVLISSNATSTLTKRLNVATGAVTTITAGNNTTGKQWASPFYGRILGTTRGGTTSNLINVEAATVGGTNTNYATEELSQSKISATGKVILPVKSTTHQIINAAVYPHTTATLTYGTAVVTGGYRNILYALPYVDQPKTFAKFMTAGQSTAYSAYSPDATTWTAGGAMPNSSAWYAMTYGGGKYVCLAQSSANAAYSTNGISWTAASLPEANTWFSVTYGKRKFVAITTTTVAAYSTDGITWIKTTLPTAGTYTEVTYGGGKFVAVSSNSATGAYSTDGITWAAMTMPASRTWWSVTYGNDMFLAIAQNGYCATSPDGITWTEKSATTGQWMSITFGNGTFVAVNINSGNSIYSTDNGTTWATSYLSGTGHNSITFGDGLFFTPRDSTNKGAISADGHTWTEVTLSRSSTWRCCAGEEGR